MCRAEDEQVVEAGFAAVGPVLNMMGVEITGVMTSRKRTSAVSSKHRAFD
jgi:hypothetical protein